VPNFFIDNFRIPPFLLPIYQAAGIEYDVPWQVLAAINEVETDYGRNLSISSAGAVGWMQFMPATWKQYGLDVTGSGVADPYNPVDAIFAAARYLHAAGASKNLAAAVFAYNHASWYVQSVLLRARLIGGMPDALVGALTGLVEGHFPVAATARYADDPREPNGAGGAVDIFAAAGSPAIAVDDGKIVGLGKSPRLGRYIRLQDATGNVYTYSHLGTIPRRYAVPRPLPEAASALGSELASATREPEVAASAGIQTGTAVSRRTVQLPSAQVAAAVALPLVKERLFAHPSTPASYAAGGAQQLLSEAQRISSFRDYFLGALHLPRGEYTLAPLRRGSIVVAGTVLGRIGAGTPGGLASHVRFAIQPAGASSPQIDPKPILDGWKLLEATSLYRARGRDPFFGPDAKNATIGQVLLMSKDQLEQRVLSDPHVRLSSCASRGVRAGSVDRRVLAVLEFLAGNGLDPTVADLVCGHALRSSDAGAADAASSSADITQINLIPILGHQGPGSITDLTIRRLLTLQGAMKPDQIISLMSYRGQTSTLALPDHRDRIQIAYTPLFGQNRKLSAALTGILKPDQWIQLIRRISQISEPSVPVAPSRYAIKMDG
jgi:hypothetical protein